MDAITRIERALNSAIALAEQPGSPPLLGRAMRDAVFPRGARLRPRLVLAVATACRDDSPETTDAAAAAIELLHCASLVHDDLPVFDNAALRRGRPTVHKAYGEPLAVLAGDALIVLAFQALSKAHPARIAPLITTVASAVGVPRGIVAGQAWECERQVDLSVYQQEKTGALFAASTVAGAAAAGVDHEPWRTLGNRLGEAYQVADDIRDAVSTEAELGKPIGQDAVNGRPNAVALLGLDGAIDRLNSLAGEATASIPHCPGARDLRALIHMESQRLLPKHLSVRAA